MMVMFNKKSNDSGFTIVELLIVIVVIAILAAITIVAYNGIQSRARDTKRASDLANIEKALKAYDTLNSGVRQTYGTGSYTSNVHFGGWDASASTNWLAFLRDTNGQMPVDPKNTMATTDPSESGNFVYYYYCYPSGPNVVIGYHKDDNTAVSRNFSVTACLE